MKTKKLLSIALAAAGCIASSLAFTGCADRAETLRVYNWGDYFDEELLDGFESWYQAETGKNINVEYDTFDTNEDMITRIEVQHEDYDLVCPSDYMAERMIKAGLAQKMDKSIFDIGGEGVLYDGLADMIKPFDPNNEYFAPYVWGTFGIMYDVNKIEAGSAAMNSWDALWSNEYSKRILMKDSVRDAYSVARIRKNKDRLSELSAGFTDYGTEYRAELNSYFAEVSEATVKEAEATLLEQKPVVLKYEVDDGKNDLLAGTTEAWLGLFWSCDSGLIMQEDAGKHFYYSVPEEGSNVWVDGWIIPKYAANATAANYFLKYFNMHENARANFDYLGTSVAQKSVMTEAKAELEADEDGFFDGTFDGFKNMYIDMMFPPAEVLARCGVMRDFGSDMNTRLDDMWIEVKTA